MLILLSAASILPLLVSVALSFFVIALVVITNRCVLHLPHHQLGIRLHAPFTTQHTHDRAVLNPHVQVLAVLRGRDKLVVHRQCDTQVPVRFHSDLKGATLLHFDAIRHQVVASRLTVRLLQFPLHKRPSCVHDSDLTTTKERDSAKSSPGDRIKRSAKVATTSPASLTVNVASFLPRSRLTSSSTTLTSTTPVRSDSRHVVWYSSTSMAFASTTAVHTSSSGVPCMSHTLRCVGCTANQ